MGVHTGDSWTVAPQQTLPDAEYQRLREAAFACARAVGVATGGANVQFAYEPETRELRVIEMNPRVSRSSALASKATGFPIAKIAALLAIGYTLDELPNDITQQTTAAFEPALDYVAVKAPRFDFAKFPGVRRPARQRDAGRRRVARARAHVPRGVPESAGRARVASRHGSTSRAAASRCRSGGTCCSRRRDRGSTFPASIRTSRKSCATIAAAEKLPLRRGAKRFGLPDRVFGDPLEVRKHRPLPGPPRSRLLRRGVRGANAVLLPLVRAFGRAACADRPGDPRARLRAEPHRPGNRVRLLLRARSEHVPRARVRGGD